MSNKYSSLFFDLDNTLYDFSTNSREVYEEVYRVMDYDQYFEDFTHYFTIYEKRNNELWGLYGEGKITKDELNAERYAYPLRTVGVTDNGISKRFWDEAMKRLPYKGKLMPHAQEILDYVHPNYRLYILSNGFTELQSHKMHSAGIDQYFDGVILSEDIGVNKPQPALFNYALEIAHASKEEAIMIGDNFKVDIEGAANVGIDQVFYNITNETSLPFAPTYTIQSLKQLKDIL